MRTGSRILTLLVVVAVGGAAAGLLAQPRRHLSMHDKVAEAVEPVNGKGGVNVSGPYRPDVDWPKPLPSHTDGWTWGGVASSVADTPDRIIVATRGEAPRLIHPGWSPEDIMEMERPVPKRHQNILVVFDRNGNLIESWNQWDSLFKTPNAIRISPYDPERHIWVADQRTNKLHKFTNDGKKLVMTLGDEDVPSQMPKVRYQDVGFWSNGDLFVIGENRVARFSKDGKYLSGFGKAGNGPGELHGLHGIATDPKNGRIYLADKDNSRIQVVDETGKVLDIWPNLVYPMSIRLTDDGRHIVVGDGYVQKFLKYDLNGKLVASWGTFGSMPGAFWGLHSFDIDSEGNLYVSEDYGSRVQKLVPRADANPIELLQ